MSWQSEAATGGVEKLSFNMIWVDNQKQPPEVLRSYYSIWYELTIRSSHRKCSVKKGVLKYLANFTGKQQFWSLFLITLQAFNPATLLKRVSNTGVFLVEHLQTTASGQFRSVRYFLSLWNDVKFLSDIIFCLRCVSER